MRQAGSAIRAEAPPRVRDDDPVRGLGNAVLLATPFWTVLGGVVWALA